LSAQAALQILLYNIGRVNTNVGQQVQAVQRA